MAVVQAPIWDGLRDLRGLPDEKARPEVQRLLRGSGLLGA
jgi:hypothetical protein